MLTFSHGANTRPENRHRVPQAGAANGHRLARTGRRKSCPRRYGFKPDPALRSFGQLLGHIADANYLFCSPVLGEANPSPGVEKTKSSKAELMAALHEAFTYAGRAYEALTEDKMNDMVSAFGGERIRLGVLWFNAAHNLEHYGSIGVYLRLKGIVPPNTESAPK